MYEKAEITLIGGEIEVTKFLLKQEISRLCMLAQGEFAQPYISVLDKIVDATREVE